MKDHITIAGHDGAFAAYIAKPKTVPAPAIIVLQEYRSQCSSTSGPTACICPMTKWRAS